MTKLLWIVVLMVGALVARGERSAEDAYDLGKFYLLTREQPAQAVPFLEAAAGDDAAAEGVRANALYLLARAQMETQAFAAAAESLRRLEELYANRPAELKAVLAEWELPAPSPEELGRQAIEEKLESIIIPEIKFMDATLQEVVRYLKEQSREHDPAGEGVNLMLILPLQAPVRDFDLGAFEDPEGFEDLDFGHFDEAEEDAPPPGDEVEDVPPAEEAGVADEDPDEEAPGKPEPELFASDITLSIDFNNIPLGVALHYIAQGTGLRLRVTPEAVVLAAPGIALEEIETRFYSATSKLLSWAEEEAEREAAEGEEPLAGSAALRRFFERIGVVWYPGTNISYTPRTAKLIVTSTPEELAKIGKFVAEIDKKVAQAVVTVELVEVLDPAYIQAIPSARLTYDMIREIPADQLRVLNTLSGVGMSGNTLVAQGPEEAMLRVTPTVGADNDTVSLEVEVLLPGPDGAYSYQGGMYLADGAGAVLPLQSVEHPRLLIIRLRLISPAGYPIRKLD